MAFKFTIGKRIGTGFGALILSVIIVFFITYPILNKSIEINETITKVNTPSLGAIEDLKLLTIQSRLLVAGWVDTPTEDPEKEELNNLVNIDYPKLQKKIRNLSKNWVSSEKDKINEVFGDIAELYTIVGEIMITLPDFDSYLDAQNKLYADFRSEEVASKTDDVIFKLDDLINRQKYNTAIKTKTMQESFSGLKLLFKSLAITMIIGGIFIAIYTTRSIVKPVNKLKNILLTLSEGVFPSDTIKARKDEIGEMTKALNRVIYGLKGTKDFANAVGSGHFDAEYEPLSENDSLGKALIKMRDDLAKNERELEQKVIERTAEVVQQKEEIEIQNEKISELYEEVTDSIKYAKGLQEGHFASR